jgi:hypothetical protein
MANIESVVSVPAAGSRSLEFWRTASGRLLGFWAASGFVNGVYWGLRLETPEWFGWLTGLGLFLCVCMWLAGDRPAHRAIAEQYGGFGLFILWPLLLPIYYAQTRGWRRMTRVLVLGMITWPGACLIGFLLGRLAA